MPPFSVKVQMPKGQEPSKAYGDRRWNFVDGGYADNSGATTAMDIYRKLNEVTAKLNMNHDVDLRIVLITSSSPQPNLDNRSIDGTVFRDTVAPIDAMLKVREDLGNDAVARACSEIYPNQTRLGGMELNESCIRHAGVGADSPLQIVEIQDQTYGLSLGWRISRTSFAVIRWMLGMMSKPADCATIQPAAQSGASTPLPDDQASRDLTPAPSSDAPDAQLSEIILRRNSCVAQLLVNLVRGSSVSAGG
jgi:hypothetical protein